MGSTSLNVTPPVQIDRSAALRFGGIVLQMRKLGFSDKRIASMVRFPVKPIMERYRAIQSEGKTLSPARLPARPRIATKPHVAKIAAKTNKHKTRLLREASAQRALERKEKAAEKRDAARVARAARGPRKIVNYEMPLVVGRRTEFSMLPIDMRRKILAEYDNVDMSAREIAEAVSARLHVPVTRNAIIAFFRRESFTLGHSLNGKFADNIKYGVQTGTFMGGRDRTPIMHASRTWPECKAELRKARNAERRD